MTMRHFVFSSLLCLTAVLAVDENSFSLFPSYAYSNEVQVQTLLDQQTFGNSWNTPSNTSYTPEITDFNRVVLELQVNSTGSNYDRLGQLFIDDIEIWRTSTAEPDNHGTTWTVRKDVSHYAGLFKTDRTINFLIENRVTDQYTGIFYVTLKAHFYKESQGEAPQGDAGWIVDLDDLPDKIVALAKSSGNPSSWSAPDDDISVNAGPLDRSINRAVVHVFASGNGDDEFWWDSDHSSAGPSRFVDVYVDGQFAGFGAPYPVIYSGGVNPYLWKPLVDLNTFDIPAHFVDITPFLPALWNGSTSISVVISNGIDSQKIPSNWIVNYNLLTWSTAGQSNSGSTNEPQYSSNSPTGENQGTVLVNRTLTTSASLNIGGKSQTVQWQQEASYNNTLVGSANSHVWQESSGTSSISGLYDFSLDYNYPFQCEMDSNQYYRVQQTYDINTNNISYYTWVDSAVALNQSTGNFQSSNSSQYVHVPAGAHYAETSNMDMTVYW